MIKKCLTYILFPCFAIFIPDSCSHNAESSIPDYPVDLQLDLNGEYATFRNSYGGILIFDKRKKEKDKIGFGGILVCTNYEGKYLAFDLACPYEAKSNIRVEIDGLSALCRKCGSGFDIYTGEFAHPQKGPAKQGLKKYRTQLSSSGILMVYR